MTNVLFDPARLSKGRLFDDDLEEDPWVIFHGTSLSWTESIEAHGFSFDFHPATFTDIQRIISIYDRMRWVGADTGGFCVLNSFSHSDYAETDTNPVFFTERSVRALRFATQDFAGGEKLRAIRRSISDLRRYLNDDALRASHVERMQRAFDEMSAMNAPEEILATVRPVRVDLTELSRDVESLADLEGASVIPFENFLGGAVYAVRIDANSPPSMSYHSSMGIKVWSAISPESIVARMDIPPEFTYNDFAIKNDFDLLVARKQSGAAALATSMAKARK